MARALLSEQEIDELLTSIVTVGQREPAEKLLETEHEHYSPLYPGGVGRQADEKFFHKKYSYGDFELHVPRFLSEGDSVIEADLQFMRKTKFPAPFLNRNKRLVNKIMNLLSNKYSENGIEIRGDNGLRQIHYSVLGNSAIRHESTPFEEWESECSLYDEPNSSGQTDPNHTQIRNDFVILRYRRRKV